MEKLKIGAEYIMTVAIRKDEIDEEDLPYVKFTDAGLATMEELVRIKSVENKETTDGEKYQKFGFVVVNNNDFGYNSYYLNSRPMYHTYGCIAMNEVKS